MRRLLRMVGRALRRRCPNCGGGGIFSRWVTLAERCPTCQLLYERSPGYWLGAIALNTAATFSVFLVVLVAGAVLTWPDVPWTGLLVVTIIVNALFPIVFYPYSKTLWMAMEIAVRPLEPDEATGSSRRD